MTWLDAAKAISIWGPGGALAAIIIFLLYRLADKFIPSFIAAQQAMAAALSKLAEGTQGLKECLADAVKTDNTEHREMIILLKVIKDRLSDDRRGDD